MYIDIACVEPHLFKADIDSAFRRIPIAPEDQWMCGMVFKVDGKVLLVFHFALPLLCLRRLSSVPF